MKLFLNIIVLIITDYFLYLLFLNIAPKEYIIITVLVTPFIDLLIVAGFWLEFNDVEKTYYSDLYNPRGNPKDDHTNY